MERGTILLRRARAGSVAALAGLWMLVLAPPLAQADVTAVSGGAHGYFLSATVLAQTFTVGPTPTVELPAGGSAGAVTASAATGLAQAGPATLFSSGPIDVSTQGTTGPAGSVTSSSSLDDVNRIGNEPLTASSVSSTCTASEAAVTASTTIADGSLQTDSGEDLNDDGDFTDPGEHPPETDLVAPEPLANTTMDGHIHVNGVQDNFRYIFNEQLVNPDGSITVNAAHQVFQGPAVTGDLIIGQSRCGVTVGAADMTAPETMIDSGPTGTIATGSAAFEFSSSEAGSTFECRLDGPGAVTGSFAACTSPKTYSGLANGGYTFSVRATDPAGNTDQSPATRSFAVAAPTPPMGVVIGDSTQTNSQTSSTTQTIDQSQSGSDVIVGGGSQSASNQSNTTLANAQSVGGDASTDSIVLGDTTQTNTQAATTDQHITQTQMLTLGSIVVFGGGQSSDSSSSSQHDNSQRVRGSASGTSAAAEKKARAKRKARAKLRAKNRAKARMLARARSR